MLCQQVCGCVGISMFLRASCGRSVVDCRASSAGNGRIPGGSHSLHSEGTRRGVPQTTEGRAEAGPGSLSARLAILAAPRSAQWGGRRQMSDNEPVEARAALLIVTVPYAPALSALQHPAVAVPLDDGRGEGDHGSGLLRSGRSGCSGPGVPIDVGPNSIEHADERSNIVVLALTGQDYLPHVTLVTKLADHAA